MQRYSCQNPEASVDTYLVELTNIINSSFQDWWYREELNMADIFPIFQKKDNVDKENYRFVSILSHMSNVFKRLLHRQIDNFMNDKLSPLLNGFKERITIFNIVY